ncbi:hypothetical protein NHX12_022991 [Muraenolepis orangiensis]|uniref:Extracellular tyrosine-protein kinase PKDCC n=1 Tax=Muraenolepis orangiensis TaxID=630683 RepID=A0A9Q0IVM9_9TELE|nr:hypothetical protein NHX12_022991 [Muraenolepis orangiensis]
MKRRRRSVVVVAGLCLSFFLGTWMNLLPELEPGLEPRPAVGGESAPGTRRDLPTGGSLLLLHHELELQIRERHDEVSRYRHLLLRARRRLGRPLERRRLMDSEPGDGWDPDPAAAARARVPGGTVDGHPDGPPPSPSPPPPPRRRRLGCGSVVDVTDVQYLGSGYTKAVYRAALNHSLSVALKSVDLQGHDMENCARRYGDTGACYRLSSLKIIKEMLLMESLEHPNVLKLYGYCYQDNGGIPETVTAITELGSPIEMIHLLQTPWDHRLRICVSLVRLLYFLSRSPLGSVSLLDFRPRQFVLVDGELKVTDLDDASAHQAPCTPLTAHRVCTLDFPSRNFTLPCSRGRCEGINEKRNLYNAYRFFFTYLLPHSAPRALRPLLDRIVNATGELSWGVEETLSKMEEVLHLYQTGRYLQNLNHSTTEQEVRCWPSYQHDACLLAVFDLREALSLCESHAHCRAFVFTNQTTWTGHHLVYFKSGWSGLSRATGQLTYIRLAS